MTYLRIVTRLSRPKNFKGSSFFLRAWCISKLVFCVFLSSSFCWIVVVIVVVFLLRRPTTMHSNIWCILYYISVANRKGSCTPAKGNVQNYIRKNFGCGNYRDGGLGDRSTQAIALCATPRAGSLSTLSWVATSTGRAVWQWENKTKNKKEKPFSFCRILYRIHTHLRSRRHLSSSLSNSSVPIAFKYSVWQQNGVLYEQTKCPHHGEENVIDDYNRPEWCFQ